MNRGDYGYAIEAFEKAIEHFSGGVAYYQYLDRARTAFKDDQAGKMGHLS